MSVSIVIPSHERPLLLRKLLLSIKEQSFRDFEVIVVDDNSGSFIEIEKITEAFTNEFPIKLLKNDQKRGAPHSRNRGITEARYELIALVDDDDAWLPQKLQRQVDEFKRSDENLGIVYTWTKVVDSDEKLLSESCPMIEGDARKMILKSCFIPSPSVMVRKKAIMDAGLFDESFPSCQDWDTWTRIIFKGHNVKVCQEFLALYYKHSGPSIGTSPRAKNGFIKYYQKHFWKLLSYGEFRHLFRLFRLKLGI